MVDVQIDSDRGELVIMIAHKSLGDMNKSKPIDNTQQGEYTNTGEITERIAIPSGIQISDTRFKNHVLTVHLQEREK
jgi:HSP20 family molecular chaperone IbpA